MLLILSVSRRGSFRNMVSQTVGTMPVQQAANRNASGIATRWPDIPVVALSNLDAPPTEAVTKRRNTLAKPSTQKIDLTVDSISETGSHHLKRTLGRQHIAFDSAISSKAVQSAGSQS